jgi:4-hydroxy-tetrahydrodipicolinate synthase
MFEGAMTALVTPFREDCIDEKTFAELVAWQIAEGTQGLVPCGTTGEAPSLTSSERDRLVRITVEVADRRVPVIAGTGTNCTASSIATTAAAKAAGADAALVVTPFYNRPTQEGLFRHFEAIAKAVDLPLILYNVPSRTGVDLAPATVGRLARIPSIIGIKDATGDMARPLATALEAGSRFLQLSGHDATAASFNLAGGRGCISVVANVVPRLCGALQRACREDSYREARALQRKLMPLIAALECETNPSPIKAAVSLVHRRFNSSLRLPLVPASDETVKAVGDALNQLTGDNTWRDSPFGSADCQ